MNSIKTIKWCDIIKYASIIENEINKNIFLLFINIIIIKLNYNNIIIIIKYILMILLF